ncbi:hypothetical protein WILDE_53 [Arthrobacter phage Wilde]|uniref:Uncharacterized protein n=1 Tax=Arthrobacter phage Wilde TaxID=1772323 RepID=A0A0U4JFA5_9CAUD|nr:hypothetical protein WILDE_53 [Arthrobacter phage Wilde]
MNGMKIEIDLAQLGFEGYDEDGEYIGGGASIKDLVVEAAAAKLVKHSDGQMQREVRERIDKLFTTEIEAKVKEKVAEAFDAPIQRTTPWGETKGEPTSVLEIIRESLEKFLKANRSRNRSSYDPAGNLEEVVDDATRDLMNKEFRAAIEEAKKGVVVTVNKKALEAAVAVLSK